MSNLGVVSSCSTNLSSSSSALSTSDLHFDSCNFMEGLRVLLVDDSRICLVIIEKMLRSCPNKYRVTTCSRAEDALKVLRANKHGFDIVVSDVHMPDMDGFKLLEHIGLEMNVPVIMMSADESKDVVMKGINCGACDYLIKPIRMEALQLIWQHVVRKLNNELKDMELGPSESMDYGGKLEKATHGFDTSVANKAGDCKSCKKRKDEDEDEEEDEDEDEDEGSEERGNTSLFATKKKRRVVWSSQLHQKFVDAVNQIGADRAMPKKILDVMNISWLTRENVASHLQKYRVYLKKLSKPQPTGFESSYMGLQDTSFGITTSCNGLALQPLMSSTMLPLQHFPTVHSTAALGAEPNTYTSPLSMSLLNQRNSFGATPPLHQSAGPAFGPMNANPYVYSQSSHRSPLFFPQMVGSQPSPQMLNLQSSMDRPFLPRANSSIVYGPAPYIPVSQPYPSMHQLPIGLGGNTFAFPSGSRIATPIIPQDYLTPNYDTVNDMIIRNTTDDFGVQVQTGFSSGQSELHTGGPGPNNNSSKMKSGTPEGTINVEDFFSDQFGNDNNLHDASQVTEHQEQEGPTRVEKPFNMDEFRHG